MGTERKARKKRKIHYALIVGAALAAIGLAAISGGKIFEFFDYLNGKQSFLGNSITTMNVVVDDEGLKQRIIVDPELEDRRRRWPNFADFSNLRSTRTKEEDKKYKELLERIDDIPTVDDDFKTISEIVAVIHTFHRMNAKSAVVEDGVLGRSRSHPEDYVYQLASRFSACGTVAEATVALFRHKGFRSRLVITSLTAERLEASHIFAEVYSVSRGRWIMVDPMVNYTAADSIFNIIGTDEAARISRLHDVDYFYTGKSAVWFDRHGIVRKKYLYSPAGNIVLN